MAGGAAAVKGCGRRRVSAEVKLEHPAISCKHLSQGIRKQRHAGPSAVQRPYIKVGKRVGWSLRRQLLQQRRERVGHVIIPRRLVLRPVFGLVLLLLLVTVLLLVLLLWRKVASAAPLRVRFAEPEAEPKGLVLKELIELSWKMVRDLFGGGVENRGDFLLANARQV